MKTVNVAIADDQILFRKGMVSIVNTFENIHISIEVSNGKELIETIEAA